MQSTHGRTLAERRAAGSRAPRWVLAAAAAPLALALAACGNDVPEPFAPGPPTNLVIVSVDTLRPDRLGAYGHTQPTSPTFDRLAREGTLFTHAAAVSPWTLPSHASLLTGLYPLRHGAKDYGDRIAGQAPLLAERLREAGFDTAAVVSSGVLGERSGMARGFERFARISEWSEGVGVRRLRNPGREVTARALEWLDGELREPFFLFVHYYDPHSDYAAREEHRRRFTTPYAGDINGSTRQLLEVLEGRRELSPEDVARLRELYDAEIRQIDAELAALVERLDAGGLSRRTALVVTSDHGEEFMERGSVLHARTYFQEVIAVPLVLRGAGVPAGLRVDAPVSLVDVAPTLLSLVGAAVPPAMEGRDLAALWRGAERGAGPAKGERRYLFAEADHADDEGDRYRMVLDARYKLILDRRTGEARLFDLETDPGEQRDLADTEPQRVRERLDALEAWEARGRAEPESAELSEDERDRLRALGYAP